MIVKTIQDNILRSNEKHIAFAINTEGYNNDGFAGQVAIKYWPELAKCGEHEIGTVISKTVGNKNFHALVCHSSKNGWGNEQSEVIKACFDKIPANGEPISTIAIGTGYNDIISGADFKQIVYGMETATNNIILYAGYTLDDIESICQENNQENKKLIRK